VFNIKECAIGTFAIAESVAANHAATSIIGGGDSVKAIKQAGVAHKVTFISTGGGASLELLEGKELPGVAALSEKETKWPRTPGNKKAASRPAFLWPERSVAARGLSLCSAAFSPTTVVGRS